MYDCLVTRFGLGSHIRPATKKVTLTLYLALICHSFRFLNRFQPYHVGSAFYWPYSQLERVNSRVKLEILTKLVLSLFGFKL